MKGERHVIGRGVDGNVRRPITEIRVGAARILTAERDPVVIAHRFARGRRQLYVEYVEDDLGVSAARRQYAMTVGVGWVQ